VAGLIGRTSAALRPALIAALRASFASTLDVLLVVSAGLALVGAVFAAALIRSKDFVVSHPPVSDAGARATSAPAGQVGVA
jgi:hypothetical protein